MSINSFLKNAVIENRALHENLVLRFFLAPIYKTKRIMEHRQYKKSVDSEHIKRFKDIYKNERCFIIGNGPSLDPKDLDKLKNEITFGCNQIYKIFDRTEWRPTYYVSVDKALLKKEFDQNRDIPVDCQKFIDIYGRRNTTLTNTIFIFAQPNYTINPFNEHPKFSNDISDHIAMGQTVTYTMIQMAVYMGFKEIYLLGIDFSMPYIKDKYGRIHKTNEKKEHFDGAEIKYSHTVTAINYQSQLNAFINAKEYCEKNGVRIFNSTRGGKLEVYDRITLESVLEG